jgi:hypothetical protein
VAETEASGDFGHDQVVEPETIDELDYQLAEPDDDTDRFNAFDANTWTFQPEPPPWYRTKPAVAALIAATIATVALVVAVVLLAFRGPSARDDDAPASPSPTAPTSAPSTPATTSPPAPLPPPPPPPPPPAPPPPAPPPPATAEAPADSGPANGPPPQPRQTKEPEFGVTRTPETRSPISVAPQIRPRN